MSDRPVGEYPDLDLEPRPGSVAPELAVELPGLYLRWVRVAGAPGPPSRAMRARLRGLADRRRGVDAVALRTRPLPRAYRAFARQIGLDPDVERIAAERAEVDRLTHGGLDAAERIAGACLIAVVETGVGVTALDGAGVAAAGPGIRVARVGEPRGIAPGTLVIADPVTVHGPLFGDPHPGSAPGRRTRELVLFAVGVPGAPQVHLDEALWLATNALAER